MRNYNNVRACRRYTVHLGAVPIPACITRVSSLYYFIFYCWPPITAGASFGRRHNIRTDTSHSRRYLRDPNHYLPPVQSAGCARRVHVEYLGAPEEDYWWWLAHITIIYYPYTVGTIIGDGGKAFFAVTAGRDGEWLLCARVYIWRVCLDRWVVDVCVQR